MGPQRCQPCLTFQHRLPADAILATLPTEEATELRGDLDAMPHDIAHGVCPSRVVSAQNTWKIWCHFCDSINVDPGLSQFQDPFPVLYAFARRWRDGRLAPRGKPVRARTAEDAVRAVGQAFSQLGAPDPCLTNLGKMDLRLTRVITGWKRTDPSPERRKPVPKYVLFEADRLARSYNQARELAIADLMWIGFFYLLRPGEYLYATKGRYPFTLGDIVLRIGAQEYTADTIPLHLLHLVSYAGLTFTMQKNGVPGELIGLTTTGASIACPVRSILRRVQHVRAYTNARDTPLYAYFDQAGVQRRVSDRHLTASLPPYLASM
jgi:thiol-disulfide isomerase/thioredoxin